MGVGGGRGERGAEQKVGTEQSLLQHLIYLGLQNETVGPDEML